MYICTYFGRYLVIKMTTHTWTFSAEFKKRRIPKRRKDRQGSRLWPRFFFRQLSLCSPRGVTYFKTRRAKKSSAITQPPIHAAFHEPKRLIHAATCDDESNGGWNPPESSISAFQPRYTFEP